MSCVYVLQGLGLLINLVEHSARNRHCLVDMETPCSFDSFCAVDGNDSLQMEGQVGAIEALVQVGACYIKISLSMPFDEVQHDWFHIMQVWI